MCNRPVIEVVAAIIRAGERLLICQRPETKSEGSHWEFPGGKIEPGETGPEALVRECREELAVTLEVGARYTGVETERPGKTLRINFYWADLGGQSLTLLEHQAARWVTLDALDEYAFCPADRVVADRLRREGFPQAKGDE